MKTKRTTSISICADRQFVKYMGILAAIEGQSIGALVRKALDMQYGDQLKRIDVQLTNGGGQNATPNTSA